MASEADATPEICSFSRLYPPHREKYLQEAWFIVESALSEYGIDCELNLVERCMIVSTTAKTRDPYMFVKAKDLLRLLARSVSAPQAIKILKDDMYSEIINIRHLVPKKKRYVERRQQLLGPNSSNLKTLEDVTGCYIRVQGKTVAVMGSSRGVNKVRLAVEKCMNDKGKQEDNSLEEFYESQKLLEEKEEEDAMEFLLLAQKLGVVTIKDTDPPTFSLSIASMQFPQPS
ncbi:unnamed protein product [Microthlaspi erraticum]|uniref:KRR-R motif-containing protein 1 n=1 Tax=Microthlaspi erraticum TaxID=1685480 RepID=A0A6D2HWT6_9BRAS|nr:unnamed protein product [Microthlaspi erraticum]